MNLLVVTAGRWHGASDILGRRARPSGLIGMVAAIRRYGTVINITTGTDTFVQVSLAPPAQVGAVCDEAAKLSSGALKSRRIWTCWNPNCRGITMLLASVAIAFVVIVLAIEVMYPG